MDWKSVYEECLSDTLKFPWSWYGGVPKIAPLHIYLCRFIHPYIESPQRCVLVGNPTWNELKNFCRQYEDLNPYISTMLMYCQKTYEKDDWERKSVEIEVFTFVKSFSPFLKDFEQKVIKTVGYNMTRSIFDGLK